MLPHTVLETGGLFMCVCVMIIDSAQLDLVSSDAWKGNYELHTQ